MMKLVPPNTNCRSAGSRDSALTNHGADQARRLGDYLAANRPPLTRVFASPLSRALKTATALTLAQPASHVTVCPVPELVERDFGYYEGKPSSARKQSHLHEKLPGFVHVESKDLLARRSDTFLHRHLLPLLDEEVHFAGAAEHLVAIVSHGQLLSTFWRTLLRRLPTKSITIAPHVTASRDQPLVLDHLGGWSNTGFLELSIQRLQLTVGSQTLVAPEDTPTPCAEEVAATNKTQSDNTVMPLIRTPSEELEAQLPTDQSDVVGDVSVAEGTVQPESDEDQTRKLIQGYCTTILTVDGNQHLAGLKRTRGGIGRAAHDDKQKTMDSFFKRARKD
jgi:broad specificity phosphatase PhoE